LILFSGCEIKEPSAPQWDIDLNLPFSNKSYNIFDILRRSGNVGFDSSNNKLAYLFGESNYKRVFGDEIKFDGFPLTNITAVSTVQFDTSLKIDDSTFIRRAHFLNGILNFTFFNTSNEKFVMTAIIKNLFNTSNDDTVRIQRVVNSGQQENIVLNLENYYLLNSNLDNTFKLRLIFESLNPVPVNFNYSLSQYSIKSLVGRLRPLNTGVITEEVIDPFGADVPEGEVNFATITPDKNFIILKKFTNLYRVDFTRLSITGENKSGRRVKLKYLSAGNQNDPLDSVFTLILPADKDSALFPLNQSNSNILEFINNIPKKITLTRIDFLNSSYQEGSVRYTDSLSIRLLIQVPLDVSVSEPIVFSDTSDAGISNEDQRKQLDNAKELQFSLRAENGFPLKAIAKILILDSNFTPLLAVSKIFGNNADSSVTVRPASVGPNGIVNNINTTTFTAELDSSQISKLKQMGKIIYEYKLYTDPDFIPSPLTTVKLTGNNRIRMITVGKLKYRVNFQ